MTAHHIAGLATPLRSMLLNSVLALGAGLLIACGDAGTTAPQQGGTPAPVARVAVTPEQGTLVAGRTLQLRAYPLSARGDTLRDRPVTWRSSNPAVATVTGEGLVTAVGEGTASVLAKAGTVEQGAPIVVSPRAVASVEIDLRFVELEEGLTLQVTAVVRDADGGRITDRIVGWQSSDPTIASVNASGTITALRWGTATVSATVEGKSAAGTVRVTARSAFDLLFDSGTAFDNAPELYRLDFRSPGATPTRVLPLNGGTWDVTASPDGSKIAFTAREAHTSQIFVANRDGSGIRKITFEPGSADQPAWSPDGSRIAFRGWAAGGPPGPFNRADIFVVDADGGTPANLTGEIGAGTWAESPTWSARQGDGSYRIAYSQQTMSGGYRVGRIVSMRADGSDKLPVTASSEALHSHPAWSPDGSAIVYVRTGGTASGDLWIVNVLTGMDRQLTMSDPGDEQRTPAWSPDGALIAFTSNHEPGIDGNYQYQIYTMSATGTGIVRRTLSGTAKENPAWIRRP